MLTRHWIMLIAALTLLASGLVGGVIAQSGLAARPTSVAVVDIQRVFAASAEKSDLEAEITQRAEALQQEGNALKERISKMRNGLDMLEPGSPSHRSKVEEIQQATFEAENWRKWEQQKLQFQNARIIKRLYASTVDAVEDVADQNGIDLVFFREPDLQERYENPQQATAQVQLRKLLWATDDVDITDAVISRMNLNYQNR
ncbi:OmpH family outer membrane protein [Mucisphaera calidilacus]|uniref:Periplasmic chaperone n=1 Tax=Mucisphaera calidilacus TaxID=2527982 RepID=A0A518C0X9_9BACT|nr:OmpH family outer membrane protein [Mucisphaera calidilacus]QDU72881.1 periplasmic chaperone [Mucisphaera calidilacus]